VGTVTAAPNREWKTRIAGETRAREVAEKQAREAIVRAERAEQSERNLTRQLDIAHRELDLLRALVASNGWKQDQLPK
jgi:hypothetical protein